MKYWLLIVVVIIAILPDASWPMENPSIRSPIISATAPPSSISSGLIQSPNPIDTSGNLVITGNVIGGRHFRALVPYGSTTSFQAPVGSSSLDSFLRYSADLQDVGPYTDGYGPYYSPTGTVTITRPGQAGIFTPAMVRTWARAVSLQSGVSTDELAMPGGQATSDLDVSAFQMRLRPMSRTPQELEKVISDELSGVLPPHEALRYLRTERLPLTQSDSEQYQDGTSRFQHELKQNLTAEAVESEDGSLQGLRSGTFDTRFSPLDSPPSAVLRRTGREHQVSSIEHQVKRFETQLPQPQSGQLPAFPQTRPTLQDRQPESDGAVFPSDRAELEELIRAAEKKAQGLLWNKVQKKTPKQIDKQLHVYEQIKQRLDDLVTPKAQDSRLKTQDLWHESDEADSTKAKSVSVKTEGFGDGYSLGTNHPQAALEDATLTLGWTGSTRPVPGEHPQKRTASKDKFNFYMQAAELYLKQGRYYRAVDAYTMASIYKPGDPLAYVGKSGALFAAGEYIGSALFLSRALQVAQDKDEEWGTSQKERIVRPFDFTQDRRPSSIVHHPSEMEVFRFGSEVLGLLDKDELERRITDAEQRLKLLLRSSSTYEGRVSNDAELQFLLGYIYYQLGRLDAAKNAIDAADQQIRNSAATLRQAISAVKKAIDKAVGGSQPAIQ